MKHYTYNDRKLPRERHWAKPALRVLWKLGCDFIGGQSVNVSQGRNWIRFTPDAEFEVPMELNILLKLKLVKEVIEHGVKLVQDEDFRVEPKADGADRSSVKSGESVS